jgi:replicative DNA helicase
LFYHKQYTRFDHFSPREAPPEYGGGGGFNGPKLVKGSHDDFNGTPF